MSSANAVHAGSKRPLNIDEHDEDVLMAVKALGDMRSRAVAHAHAPSAEAFAAAAKAHSRASSTSSSAVAHCGVASTSLTTPLLTQSSTSASTSSSSPVSPQPPAPDDGLVLDPASKDFVSRVSHFPIVNTALQAYENTKERSRVLKYGANLVESSVKTISRPVFDRLPVEQLDEFACRQLDRLGYPRPAHADEMQLDDDAYRDPPPPRSGSPSRAPSLAPSSADEYSAFDCPDPGHDDRQVASRSKWQAVLLEAGGISAAVSEESMKRLQYCLQWLQYATAHIDSQILILRSFIDSLSPQPPHQNDSQALVPLQTMRSLTDVRRDVVSTIRQVVDVISQYAGGALPEPARASVRAFILRLPARWANASADSAPSSPRTPPPNPKYYRMASAPAQDSADAGPSTLPPHMRPTAGRGTQPTAGAAAQAAQRILVLATESLDMMRSVTGVCKESLDRAEAWVERLRVVGIQRQGQGQGQSALPPPLPPSSPGPSTSSSARPLGEREHDASHPPSPSVSLSSSVHSLTSLSLATQATTSPPTSIASWARGHARTGSGEDDAEGETETEDEGSRRWVGERDSSTRGKGKAKAKEKQEGGPTMVMDVDG